MFWWRALDPGSCVAAHLGDRQEVAIDNALDVSCALFFAEMTRPQLREVIVWVALVEGKDQVHQRLPAANKIQADYS